MLLSRRHRGMALRATAASIALIAAAFTVPALPAAAARPALPHAGHVRAIAGRTATAAARPADHTAMVAAPPTVAWPAAGSATVTARSSGWVRAGSLPVEVSGPGKPVRVEVLDRTATVRAGRPMVMRLAGDAGLSPVRLRVDYSGFADAFGGSWASRLTLVELPECALTAPGSGGCAERPLSSVNDPVLHTVSATVTLSGAAVVALASAPSSGSGDYTATALEPSATWSAGDQSGDFTWSYPVRVPPSLGGPSPQVSLSYSSQSVDGKTAASNAQPSWIGEGFNFWPGAISRTYKACTDDGVTGVGDECWGGDNATLTMSGRGGELIQVSTNPDTWRLRSDDGTRVERFTGANNADDNGEYWKVTTTDGTQYFFGLGRLPGWSTGQPVTGSVWSVPVFGNNSGEPCHQSTFAASYCSQAYQWNLDYVVDPHGNTMSVWYAKEYNSYSRNAIDTSVSSYTRGGTIAHIDYGTRLDAGVDSEFLSGTYPPQRVVFTTQDRCITQGSTCSSSNPANWPDVPWDLVCTSTTSCPGLHTPSFFTQKTLSTVTTQVWTGPGNTYADVDTWTLGHVFKDPGDNNAKILWLGSLSHAGKVGGTATVPDITFTPVQMNNRVDISGSKDPITRFRLASVADEYGSVVSATYSAPECVAGTVMPASPDTNTKRCFPVYWTNVGSTTPTLEYFHKFVVTAVTQTDLIGGAPALTTSYTYLGTPMWHYDEAEFVTPSRRTWGQWRGYGKVRVTEGAAGTTQSQTDTVYFRGMNGDKTATGTRTITIPADPDFGGSAVNDEPWRAGQAREKITYNGTGDTAPVVAKVLYAPWEHGPTAIRTRNGITVNAYATGVATTTVKTALDGGRGWRTVRTSTTYDYDAARPNPVGRPVAVDNAGDLSTTADDQCTRYTYAENAAAWKLTSLAEVETVAVGCAATPDRSRDVISDVRTWYDGASTFGTAISKGDATRTDQLSAWNAGSPTYTQITRASYDAYGRVLDAYDPLDHKTSTTYTPAAAAPVTSVTATNPFGWTTVTAMDPAWGKPLSSVDQNGHRTDLAYDGLGRLTAAWLPGRSKSSQSATFTFTYVVRNTGGPSATAESRLGPDGTGYATAWTLYDGLLRVRQVQGQAPTGGRVIADTEYDSRGLPSRTTNPYFDAQAPSASLFVPTGAPPGRTVTSYDGSGRPIVAAFQIDGVEKWRTTTYYGGDHADVTVPAGGTATSTWTDARGNTTAVRQFHGNVASGAYDTTSYSYTGAGDLASITDPLGNMWHYTWDQLRRKVAVDDPDKGHSSYTYDDAGELLTTTDARGTTLAYGYDTLGRKTGLYRTSTAGTKLAGWTYDTIAKGRLTSSTRYVGGDAYTVAVTGYNDTYQPTGRAITIPAVEGALAGTYTTAVTYKANGSVAAVTSPINPNLVGGLPAETLSYGYNSIGLPTTLSGLTSYIVGTDYDGLARRVGLRFSDGGGKTLSQVWDYEDATGRLTEHGVLDDQTSTVYQDARYGYDDFGDITSIKDQTSQYGAGADDNQCFRYDYLRRLTDAWTPANGDCATAPATGGLGGPAAYWQSWTYDLVGDRLTQVDHAVAGDTTRTSTYPAAGSGAVRPHAVSAISVTGPGGTTSSGFTYDEMGDTTSRPGIAAPQALTWGAEGRLISVLENGQTTGYVYDADGNRLVERVGNAATLYLDGEEYHTDGSSVTETRYYGTDAVRTATGVSWLTSDHHGTAELSFSAAQLTSTHRYLNPFGGPRAAAVALPGSRGFVAGTIEPTGLVMVGARQYDPATGRFLSSDPVLDQGDPQSWQGYGYADNAPATLSDPSGLRICLEECGSADDKEFQKVVKERKARGGDFGIVQGSCTRQSASDCDPQTPSPTQVVNRVIFPNNTVLSYLANGVVLINGVPLPPGCADPYKLAADMDKEADKVDVDPKTGMAYDGVTAALIVRACDRQVAAKLCTFEMRTKMDELHQRLQADAASSGTLGICLTATSFIGGPTAGGQVCLVTASDGVAITVSGIGGAGTPGAGASVTFQTTTAGTLKDLCGPFGYVAGSYGPVSGGFASGGGVLVSEVGAGVGPPNVQGGVSNTVAVIKFGGGGMHNECH